MVGFGVRPVDEPQWNLYLFSVPKVENNWPFCSSPYRLSRVAWWDNNGVCDILEGKHVCDAIQNNRSQSLKFEKRAAAETNSLDPDRVYPLGNKTTETFVAQRLFSVEGSELLDCAALHTSGWLVPLVKATSGELNPNPYALTVTSRTASSEVRHLQRNTDNSSVPSFHALPQCSPGFLVTVYVSRRYHNVKVFFYAEL